jgi:hypothetical protein
MSEPEKEIQMSYLAQLGLNLPPELVDEFQSKLHYVSEFVTTFELTEGRDGVRFELRPGASEQASIVVENIVETAQKMCRAHRPGEVKLITSRQGSGAFADDPHALLEAEGDLFRFGQGRYGFGPRLLDLIEFFDNQLFQRASQFMATPHQFPTLIGADVMERCRYTRSFTHTLSLVSHLREDLRAIQNFAQMARWDGDRLVCDAQDLAGSECMLSPNVCFHCYAWLRDSTVAEPRAITAVGKCFRYESGNLTGLERLWDFTMREWIFVGDKEYVLQQREKATDETIRLLDEWDLTYEIKSASDPVSVDEYQIATFQMAFDLKYEIQAALPYRGKTLAVGSLNFHRDFFGRALNVTLPSGEAANMGCAAFGVERLALAFLAQHGLDAKRWPAAVADQLKRW